ncbi:MAG: MerR family transcriptional regulator [Anaerolineaceae bacterium]|jgi:DNA-binding transcriptional MerR regulator
MLDDQLLISELAERASVSVRTIRFYISEGLLPPPQARGRYSVYDEEYLTRIELIKRLKGAYLPLKEIRRMVESLSREEIERMLHKLSEPSSTSSPASSPAAARNNSGIRESGLPEALDYISRVLQSQATPASKAAAPLPSALPPMPAPLSQPGRPHPATRASLVQESDSQPEESESSWRHYTIQPGVELLVSEKIYHQSALSIHQIVAQIKQLFSNFPTGGKNV